MQLYRCRYHKYDANRTKFGSDSTWSAGFRWSDRSTITFPYNNP